MNDSFCLIIVSSVKVQNIRIHHLYSVYAKEDVSQMEKDSLTLADSLP